MVVGEEAAEDGPLTDSGGAAEVEPLGSALELAGGLAEVTKVVGAAAVAASDAGLDTGIAVAGSLSVGILMA